MNKYFTNKRKKGYTIIETMIAVSLFLVVMSVGMGSFLNANVVYQKSSDTRAVVDNLNFIMEDMSRNLRTGYNYRCITNGADFNTAIMATPRSGENCFAIAFDCDDPTLCTSSTGDQWVYKAESTNGGLTYNIYKSIDSGNPSNWVQLNACVSANCDQSGDVFIESAGASPFSVLGAEPPSFLGNNKQQPFVIIKLMGKINFKNLTTSFPLQTSVSQRLIDVN